MVGRDVPSVNDDDPLPTLERGARLTLRLLIRGSCSNLEAASITGVTLMQATKDMRKLSSVVPIYYSRKDRRWIVCQEQLIEYQNENSKMKSTNAGRSEC